MKSALLSRFRKKSAPVPQIGEPERQTPHDPTQIEQFLAAVQQEFKNDEGLLSEILNQHTRHQTQKLVPIKEMAAEVCFNSLADNNFPNVDVHEDTSVACPYVNCRMLSMVSSTGVSRTWMCSHCGGLFNTH
jgi:hypothetical protein